METKGVLSRPSKRQDNGGEKPEQAHHIDAMDLAIEENASQMTKEQKKKVETQKQLGIAESTYSQLVDRLETNSFQG